MANALGGFAAQQLGYGQRRPVRPDIATQQQAVQRGQDYARAVNPAVFNKPQVLASMDGRPMAWQGGPALRPGQTLPGGARVMVGQGTPTGMRTNPTFGGASTAATGNVGQAAGSAGSAGMGGMPGNSQSTTGLPAEIQKLLDQANAANESRYQTLLGNEAKDKAEVMGALKSGWDNVLNAQQKGAAGVTGQMNAGWDSILGLVGQQSTDAAMERERRYAKNELGRSQQSLTNRGLVNTTVLDAQRRGINDDSRLRQEEIMNAARDREIGVRQNMLSQTVPTALRLNEQQQGIMQNQMQQQIPALMRQNDSRQGIIERRQDEGPNIALWAQLLQQEGASRQASEQARLAAQNNATNAYSQIMQQILSRMPVQYVGGQTGPNGQNRSGSFGRMPQGATGFRNRAPQYEQNTGATNVNNGFYDRGSFYTNPLNGFDFGGGDATQPANTPPASTGIVPNYNPLYGDSMLPGQFMDGGNSYSELPGTYHMGGMTDTPAGGIDYEQGQGAWTNSPWQQFLNQFKLPWG